MLEDTWLDVVLFCCFVASVAWPYLVGLRMDGKLTPRQFIARYPGLDARMRTTDVILYLAVIAISFVLPFTAGHW